MAPKEQFAMDSPENWETNKNKKVDFDELLPIVGQYGLYQVLLFFLLLPFCFFIAFIYMSQMFITLVPEDYSCAVDLGNATSQDYNLTYAELKNLMIPVSESSRSKCEIFNVTIDEAIRAQEQNQTLGDDLIVKCNKWDYNRDEVSYESIATEFNWVCDKDYYSTLGVGVYYVGAIIGGFLFGWIADHFGRMPACIVCNLVGFFGGAATLFVQNFWQFALSRFVVGFAYDNCYMMIYIIVLEYTGVKWRTVVANMSIGTFFTFAMCLTPWIAVWSNGWRIFTLITTAPLLLVILTPLVVPESARWLLSQGKVKKCVTIMRRIAKINQNHVDEEVYERFIESNQQQSSTRVSSDDEKQYTIIDLVKRPKLRKTLFLLCIMWMSTSFVFDGHARNAGSVGSNIFIAHTLGSFTEFPADIILVLILDKWGRRLPCGGALIIGGAFSIIATIVPFGLPSTVLAILGRATANFSFNLGCQYATELLPTVVRGQGTAFIHICGYIASIIAPFVVYLANISKALPLIIFGLIGVLGGLCCLFLPESLGCELPQTLEDGENMDKGQSFCYAPCCGRNKTGGDN